MTISPCTCTTDCTCTTQTVACQITYLRLGLQTFVGRYSNSVGPITVILSSEICRYRKEEMHSEALYLGTYIHPAVEYNICHRCAQIVSTMSSYCLDPERIRDLAKPVTRLNRLGILFIIVAVGDLVSENQDLDIKFAGMRFCVRRSRQQTGVQIMREHVVSWPLCPMI